jgi:hypothetical protein
VEESGDSRRHGDLAAGRAAQIKDDDGRISERFHRITNGRKQRQHKQIEAQNRQVMKLRES